MGVLTGGWCWVFLGCTASPQRQSTPRIPNTNRLQASGRATQYILQTSVSESFTARRSLFDRRASASQLPRDAVYSTNERKRASYRVTLCIRQPSVSEPFTTRGPLFSRRAKRAIYRARYLYGTPATPSRPEGEAARVTDEGSRPRACPHQF